MEVSTEIEPCSRCSHLRARARRECGRRGRARGGGSCGEGAQAPTGSKRTHGAAGWRAETAKTAGEGKAGVGAGICARIEWSRRGRSCYVQKVSI